MTLFEQSSILTDNLYSIKNLIVSELKSAKPFKSY